MLAVFLKSGRLERLVHSLLLVKPLQLLEVVVIRPRVRRRVEVRVVVVRLEILSGQVLFAPGHLALAPNVFSQSGGGSEGRLGNVVVLSLGRRSDFLGLSGVVGGVGGSEILLV